jgi:glutamate dehydrogenase
MEIQNQRRVEQITRKIKAHADNHYTFNDLALFKKFIKLYFNQAPADDLEGRSTNHLYGLVHSHWLLFRNCQLKTDEAAYQLFNPEVPTHQWESTHTILQLVAIDMPFLVDSIRMEIDRLGLTNYFMIYTGGVVVTRDDNGLIQDVKAQSVSDGEASSELNVEAPIHVEIDRQTDSDKLTLLRENIKRVIADVYSVTRDWIPMCKVVDSTIAMLEEHPDSVDKAEIQESIAYLSWLLNDHFIFFGMRDYEVKVRRGEKVLELVSGSGLGVLRTEEKSKKTRYFHELLDDVQKMMLSKKHVLVITKTNTQSTVHRVGYTDYLGVKRFDEKGNLLGERRFVGLFTSSAYEHSPETVPLLRRKVFKVLTESGFPKRSHAGKDIMHILRTLPRDDLFQASVSELLNLSLGIVHLQERKKIRLFVRKDVYERFLSCLVFVPRERFSSDLITQMQLILMNAFSGTESSFTTHFSASVLAQIHFVIRLDKNNPLNYDLKKIEADLILAGESWDDLLKVEINDCFGEEKGLYLNGRYANTFQPGYIQRFTAKHAVSDIAYIENLNDGRELEMNAYDVDRGDKHTIGLKLYRKGATVPLSDALPMLENMGLRVIGEEPYQLIVEGEEAWINDLYMEYKIDLGHDFSDVKDIFQQSFYQVWLGHAENDAFNTLTLVAKLDWRKVTLLRAYARYCKQIGVAFSLEYIAETLIKNVDIVCLLVELFNSKFDPATTTSSADMIEELTQKVIKKLELVKVLDEDRILRKLLCLINATTRTNYFQQTQEGRIKEYLAFKINPNKLQGFPLPVPFSEIFVYSPRFEGVHIRFDKVARGGLRWSSRREDYRTEVLGLSKAQQVKNSIIVPAGAKGGFVTKKLPVSGDRDAVFNEGVTCYRLFINGLLDCVDNLVDGQVVMNEFSVVYDDPDPYLVVAADKGTATFSDFANEVSESRSFWLGDAFASGGVTGYDHKKIGITARGAWISAQRHFQELGVNIETSEISVVGIGDMAGDVFGNGMLMSNKIKLVAAFNHMHIFIDPNPDPGLSFQERLRLFNLPRSSWMDYDSTLISSGGGVYSRADKQIKLSKQVMELFGIEGSNTIVPEDMIKAILRGSVDMIWNGGIGTFIKAENEAHSEVGDRGNDNIRISASELHAQVFCEGGNLGLTQRARIEYALNGGCINTDFIDNSAGVDCSDHEVNLKIMLNTLVSSGKMKVKQRNQLLKKMTDDVAVLVLQDNYHQNRLISASYHYALYYFSLYHNFIKYYDARGDLDRQLERLPTDEELDEREKHGIRLTKPEISVLISRAKIFSENRLRQLPMLDNEFYQSYVLDYFPLVMRKRYADSILNHRLYREILSTRLSNMIVTDMGFSFVFQLEQESEYSFRNIVNAFLVAREVFSMRDIQVDIQSCDYLIATEVQHEMGEMLVQLVRRSICWFLHYDSEMKDLALLIEEFKPFVKLLYKRAPHYLKGNDKYNFEAKRDFYINAGVPESLAAKVAILPYLYHSLIVINSANSQEKELLPLAQGYYKIIQRLELIWLRDKINAYQADTQWIALAKRSVKIDLDDVQAKLALGLVHFRTDLKTSNARINAWVEVNQHFISKWSAMLDELKLKDEIDFAMLTVLIKELVRFAQNC